MGLFSKLGKTLTSGGRKPSNMQVMGEAQAWRNKLVNLHAERRGTKDPNALAEIDDEIASVKKYLGYGDD